MYRVCIEKATGKLIEMQSGGRVERFPKERFKTEESYQKHLADCDALEAMRLNTLGLNAVNAGYKEDDIEVKFIDGAEWSVISAEINKPNKEKADAESLIQAKMREQAITVLKAEGKLDMDGKIPIK